MSHDQTTPLTPDDDNQLIAERREKLSALREQAAASGSAVFPNDFKPQHRAAALHLQAPASAVWAYASKIPTGGNGRSAT